MHNDDKLKLAQANLAKFRASLAYATNKDQVRRQIAATLERIAQIEASPR